MIFGPLLISGIIVFVINYIVSRIISLIIRFINITSSNINFIIWVERLIIVSINTLVFLWMYRRDATMTAKNMILIAATGYAIYWFFIILRSVIRTKKSDLGQLARSLLRQMRGSLVLFAAAWFLSLFISWSRTGQWPSIAVRIPDSCSPVLLFISIVAGIVVFGYMIGGVVLMVSSSRSKLMYAGFGVFAGLLLVLTGLIMGGFLLFAPKPVAGLFMMTAGIALHELVRRIGNDSESVPPVITFIAGVTILPGLGLLIAALA